MLPFIIGGILIIGGGILGFIVPRKMKNKNIEIKFLKTIPVSELLQGEGLKKVSHLSPVRKVPILSLLRTLLPETRYI